EPDDLVALSEVEGRLVGAKDPPFHRIFGLDHIELAAECGGVLLFGQSIGPHRGPDQEAKRIGLLAQRLSEAGRSQAHAHEQKSQPSWSAHEWRVHLLAFTRVGKQEREVVTK